MPKYRNDGTTTLIIGGKELLPGATMETTKYVKDRAGLTIVDHAPRYTPRLLLEDSLPTETVSGLVDYSSITIVNDCNSVVRMVFNEDTDNALVVFAQSHIDIDLDDTVYSISFTGSGTGTVYMWGYPK